MKSENNASGAFCDLAVLEADGDCVVVASRADRCRLPFGTPFFQAVGADAKESQFALQEIFRDPGHIVLLKSRAGAIYLSGYFYRSVRLLLAVIPHTQPDKVVRVTKACAPDIVLSPEASLLCGELTEGDEAVYIKLQKFYSVCSEAFPPAGVHCICPANAAWKSAYRTAHATAQLTGMEFRMKYPDERLPESYSVQYDPVIGALYFLIFFCCLSSRKKHSDQGGILFSGYAVRGNAGLFLRSEIPLKNFPELQYLLDLERYGRQTMDLMIRDNRVEFRLLLEQRDPQELLGLKNAFPEWMQPERGGLMLTFLFEHEE